MQTFSKEKESEKQQEDLLGHEKKEEKWRQVKTLAQWKSGSNMTHLQGKPRESKRYPGSRHKVEGFWLYGGGRGDGNPISENGRGKREGKQNYAQRTKCRRGVER